MRLIGPEPPHDNRMLVIGGIMFFVVFVWVAYQSSIACFVQ